MITYTKLPTGEWGLRSPEKLTLGTKVTVSKRNGQEHHERVGEEIGCRAEGEGMSWIYTLERNKGKTPTPIMTSSGALVGGVPFPHNAKAPNVQAPQETPKSTPKVAQVYEVGEDLLLF